MRVAYELRQVYMPRLEAGVANHLTAVHELADHYKSKDLSNTVVVSPLFGWRQDAFIASFQKAGERWVSRSPLEQALLGLAAPWLFPSEREYLLQNTFQLSYGAFDWRLNDLTGGIPN